MMLAKQEVHLGASAQCPFEVNSVLEPRALCKYEQAIREFENISVQQRSNA